MRAKLQNFLYAASFAAITAGAAIARADSPCDSTMNARVRQTQLLVDSIRVDKPGLARVYASDGSEFTAGQALWMKGQMRQIEEACAAGDPTSAVHRLTAIQNLLTAHR